MRVIQAMSTYCTSRRVRCGRATPDRCRCPPVFLAARLAKRTWSTAEPRCAKASVMQVPFSLLHRDRYRWHAPESFDPSRFADSESVRVCIGVQLAMLKATSVLAWLTRDNVIVPRMGRQRCIRVRCRAGIRIRRGFGFLRGELADATAGRCNNQPAFVESCPANSFSCSCVVFGASMSSRHEAAIDNTVNFRSSAGADVRRSESCGCC